MAEYFLDAKKNEIIFSICHMPPVLIYMKITLDTNKRSIVLQSERTTLQRATLAERSRCRGIRKVLLCNILGLRYKSNVQRWQGIVVAEEHQKVQYCIYYIK